MAEIAEHIRAFFVNKFVWLYFGFLWFVWEEIVINDFISANNPRGQGGRMDDASDNDSNDSDQGGGDG